MQIEWAFSGSGVAGFDAVFDRYSVQEFDSPTRSTIPLPGVLAVSRRANAGADRGAATSPAAPS